MEIIAVRFDGSSVDWFYIKYYDYYYYYYYYYYVLDSTYVRAYVRTNVRRLRMRTYVYIIKL